MRRLLISIFTGIILFASLFLYIHRDEALLARDRAWGFLLTELAKRSRENAVYAGTAPEKFDHAMKNLPKGFVYQSPFLFFTASKKVPVNRLALKSIRYTSYQDRDNFISDIKRYNALESNSIEEKSTIIIPGTITNIMKARVPLVKPAYTRGIYLNAISAGKKSFIPRLPRLKKLGINTIVFDAKDIPGRLSYRSSVSLAVKTGASRYQTIDNIHHLVRKIREAGMYSIVRLAVFRDEHLVKKQPSLAIQSTKKGKVFNAGGELWCDPTNKKVQDYNIALAKELAKVGVDEIQLDYIRFPTGGNFHRARFKYDFGKKSRVDYITHFLARMEKELKKEKVFLSIDIFGIVAWGKKVDIRKTGQQISRLAEHCDVISPMLYPSHFNNNFEGIARPGDAPYHFLKKGTLLVRKYAGKKVLIRPWLQAFPWRTTTYGSEYILKQIKACEDAGAHGYLFWNVSSNFNAVYRALAKNEKK